MVDYGVTSELFRLLVTQGMKGPASSRKALNREVGADGEGGGIRHRPLTHEPREENTAHVGPSPARQHQPVLRVVSSRQNPAQRKTKRAKSCLVLVK